VRPGERQKPEERRNKPEKKRSKETRKLKDENAVKTEGMLNPTSNWRRASCAG